MTKTLARALLLVAAGSGLAVAEPTVTVSTNPVVDAIGLIDAQVELRLAAHVGVTGIAGAGFVLWDGSAPAFEVGAKISYYPWRDFSGWHLAAAANHAQAGTPADLRMSNVPSLSFVAVYAGYKWLHSSGITAEARAGAAYVADQPYDPVQPMISGSLGYSF